MQRDVARLRDADTSEPGGVMSNLLELWGDIDRRPVGASGALCLGAPAGSAPDAASLARVREPRGNLPPAVEINYSQSDPKVRFLSRDPGCQSFRICTEAVFSPRPARPVQVSPGKDNMNGAPGEPATAAVAFMAGETSS